MRALKIWGMTMVVVIAVLGLYIYQNNREYQIILLNTNDSHGSILPVDSVGGMAERATFIRMVREKNPYVLLVDAGDINTGQAISNRADAKPDILAYNYMGYDAVTVGNHEFDKPLNVLLKQMQWAEFPFVTSNIQRNGTPLGVEYLIKEIGGVKIGIFGLTTKNTENVSIHAGEVTFENEVMAARKVVKLLKKQQVNLIIGLVHLGFTESAPGFITSYRLAQEVENMIVSSADLSNSDKTDGFIKGGARNLVKGDFSGKFLQAGVAELTMAAICNGIALHGGIHVACATFFVFSDYMKPAFRLSALMQMPVKYIWTHDAFRVGEDGPTHQPIEHEAQLRLLEKMQNHAGKMSMLALRPADAAETSVAWKMAMENTETPTALVLSRQNINDLPAVTDRYTEALKAEKGAYIVQKNGENPKVILIASGSEVATLIDAAKLLLERKGIASQVVSAISEGLFRQQPTAYQEEVIPASTPHFGLTAGLSVTLEGLVGCNGKIHGVNHFGYSAPAKVLDEKFGFTGEFVYNEICEMLGK